MYTINRSAIVVRPAQPFLDWLHQVDPTSTHLTLDDLGAEPAIYLLPDCDSEEEAIRRLRKMCGAIFEEQLDSWYRVPAVWPKRRGLTTFRHWFDYSIHSMVIDLCDDPLKREDL